jgi:hypothetical protein
MMNDLIPEERDAAWEEIELNLKRFEVSGSFVGPCEMIVAVGQK